jgi:hypothetical protein
MDSLEHMVTGLPSFLTVPCRTEESEGGTLLAQVRDGCILRQKHIETTAQNTEDRPHVGALDSTLMAPSG